MSSDCTLLIQFSVSWTHVASSSKVAPQLLRSKPNLFIPVGGQELVNMSTHSAQPAAVKSQMLHLCHGRESTPSLISFWVYYQPSTDILGFLICILRLTIGTIIIYSNVGFLSTFYYV